GGGAPGRASGRPVAAANGAASTLSLDDLACLAYRPLVPSRTTRARRARLRLLLAGRRGPCPVSRPARPPPGSGPDQVLDAAPSPPLTARAARRGSSARRM